MKSLSDGHPSTLQGYIEYKIGARYAKNFIDYIDVDFRNMALAVGKYEQLSGLEYKQLNININKMVSDAKDILNEKEKTSATTQIRADLGVSLVSLIVGFVIWLANYNHSNFKHSVVVAMFVLSAYLVYFYIPYLILVHTRLLLPITIYISQAIGIIAVELLIIRTIPLLLLCSKRRAIITGNVTIILLGVMFSIFYERSDR